MRVVNQIHGLGTEDISSTLQSIFESANSSGYENFPLIIVEQYIKNNNGLFVPKIMYGMVKNPVLLYDEFVEGRNFVSIAMNHHGFRHITLENPALEFKKPIQIPVNSLVKDAREYFMRSANAENVRLPRGENIVNLYVGTLAYDNIEKIKNKHRGEFEKYK